MRHPSDEGAVELRPRKTRKKKDLYISEVVERNMSHLREAFIISMLIMGFVLVVFGAIGISGAAVGAESAKYGFPFFAGAFMVVFSAILGLLYGDGKKGDNLENIIGIEELRQRMKKTEQGHNHPVFVMDTSVLLIYSPDEIAEIIKELKSDGSDIIIPGQVVREAIHNKRQDIAQIKSEIPNYDPYKNIARSYLEKSPKNQLVKFIKGEQRTLNNTERMEYINECKKLIANVKKMTEPGYQPTKEDLIYAVGSNCETSEADVEVLAIALYEAHKNRNAVICQSDKDFGFAVEIANKELKREHKPEIALISPYKSDWGYNRRVA